MYDFTGSDPEEQCSKVILGDKATGCSHVGSMQLYIVIQWQLIHQPVCAATQVNIVSRTQRIRLSTEQRLTLARVSKGIISFFICRCREEVYDCSCIVIPFNIILDYINCCIMYLWYRTNLDKYLIFFCLIHRGYFSHSSPACLH